MKNYSLCLEKWSRYNRYIKFEKHNLKQTFFKNYVSIFISFPGGGEINRKKLVMYAFFGYFM